MVNFPAWLRRSAPFWLLALGVGMIGGGAHAAPLQQTPAPPLVCAWDKLTPMATQGVYFAGSAIDTNTNKLYAYGGVDQAGDPSNVLSALDLSNADLSKAGFQALSPAGSRLQRYGSAGAFRPKGDDSAIYWLGGADENGDAMSEVQVFNVKAGTWRKETPTGATKRVFHAAAYDPLHDAIVVHGGSERCKVANILPEDQCEGDTLKTQFLVFDPQTGAMHWENGPQGGPVQALGLSMVYDSKKKRMLAYGGTNDGNLPMDRVWALDLSKPLDQAEWKTLTAPGTQPQGRYFHSASYDANRDMMVIYGGVTQQAFTNKENALDDTWALRLDVTPPAWTNLSSSVLDRVGSAMAWAPNHRRAVLYGGRSQYRATGSQTVNRDYYTLACGAAPTPTATPRVTPPPTPGGPLTPKICAYIRSRVPSGVINDSVANAPNVRGFGEPCNPSIPPDPANNPPKRYLGLLNPGVPWDALFNPLVYNCGCR